MPKPSFKIWILKLHLDGQIMEVIASFECSTSLSKCECNHLNGELLYSNGCCYLNGQLLYPNVNVSFEWSTSIFKCKCNHLNGELLDTAIRMVNF